MTLHLKYRPTSFDEMYGNEATIEALYSKLMGGAAPHSFLFVGPSGCGKTTLARITGAMLGCEDLIQKQGEYDTAEMRGIQTIREIKELISTGPMVGNIWFILLDECHKLTNEAQNALLKMLEEPPSYVYFALCTTEPKKLLETIRQRCQLYTVSTLSFHMIIHLLKDTLIKENCVDFSKKVLTRIAEVAEGSPRRALMNLDKVIDLEDENMALSVLDRDSANEQTVIDLCQTLLKNQEGKWNTVRNILKKMPEVESDYEKVRYAVLTYFRKVLLSGDYPKVAKMIELFLESYMYTGQAGLIWSCYMACKV